MNANTRTESIAFNGSINILLGFDTKRADVFFFLLLLFICLFYGALFVK